MADSPHFAVPPRSNMSFGANFWAYFILVTTIYNNARPSLVVPIFLLHQPLGRPYSLSACNPKRMIVTMCRSFIMTKKFEQVFAERELNMECFGPDYVLDMIHGANQASMNAILVLQELIA